MSREPSDLEEEESFNLFDSAAENAQRADTILRAREDLESLEWAKAHALTSIAQSLVEIALAARDFSQSMHTEQATIDEILASQPAPGDRGSTEAKVPGLTGHPAKVISVGDDDTITVERIDRPGITFTISIDSWVPRRADPD